jgi:hypothetical protein
MSPGQNSLTDELRIILNCAGSELSFHEPVAVKKIITENTDWQRVIDYTQHHRLIPQVYGHLNKHCCELVPGDVLAKLKNLNDEVIRQSLAQAASLTTIIPALNKRGIDVAILKGRALAKKLYGNIALRQSRDIDLLVRQGDVITADMAFHELGYSHSNHKTGLPLNTDIGRKFIKGRSELDYMSHKHGICIDLHWHLSLSSHAFPVDMKKLWTQMKRVQGDYGQLSELPITMHFIFLCYHGAKHHWLRLHWLQDIAILVNQGELDWSRVIVTAKRLGVLPTVILATRLAKHFFNTPLEAAVKQQTRNFTDTDNLAGMMIGDMIRAPADIEKNVAPYMDFKRIRTGYRLQTIFKHRFLTWTDLLFPSDSDYQSIRIPASLSYLYYLVRCFRLALKLKARIIHSITHRDAAATSHPG